MRRSRRLVFDVVRREGTATRADVQRLTGLSRSAVAETVADLLAGGRLVEHRPTAAPVARGRPAGVLMVVDRVGSVVGVDLGHAHVAVMVAGTAGNVLAERWSEVDVDHEPGRTFDTVERLVAECAEVAGIAPADLLGAAVGVPGPVGAMDGALRSRTILRGWGDERPARELQRRLGLPVVVGNDADMGARGELHFGAGRGLRDLLYVKASHGIGAGLVLGGRSYRGSLGLAGEIGHSRIGGATGRCRCGRDGCLETVASVEAVRCRLLRSNPLLSGAGGALADLVCDAGSRRIAADAGRALGRVLADLCNCLNPQAVLIGGELGAIGAPVIAGAREAIDRYAQPATARAVVVRRAQLGLRAELLGAAWAAVEQARLLA